jgi:Tfp pilus assembly protein PilX
MLTFNVMEHDFGKVKAGERVGCIFTYTNTGDADLAITSASASCGCTVPKYDRKPIPPDGTGTFEVVFDTSGREGTQTKTVVVQSNAENNMVILRIIAEVQKETRQ